MENALPALIDPDPTPGTPGIDPANPTNLLVPAVDGTPLTLPLGTYFIDPDGDTLTITPNPAAIPSWLTWNPLTQTFTGTPPVDNTGLSVIIPVLINDGNGGTFAATMTIRPANPPPVAVDASVTTPYLTPVVVPLLANDTDPDNDPLTVTSATLADPATGTLAEPTTLAWTFTPASASPATR